ncbi:MAG TPA: SIR2 family protein [Polyangiales bacterium]|nr:SIR2 family protein [Polyangiales bacterium]
MAETESAKTWLRAHGFGVLADTIDKIEGEWAAQGRKTRRNWWDVLAGTRTGAPRVIEGRRFPILPEARLRQGLPLLGAAPAAPEIAIDDAAVPEEPPPPVRDEGPPPPVLIEPPPAPELPPGATTPSASEPSTPPAVSVGVAAPVAPSLLDGNAITLLERHISQGRVVLLTGAGFSLDAKDQSGRPLPLTTQLTQELAQVCFPGDPVEDSFGDLFAYGERHRPRELRAFLTSRLQVDPASLAPHYRIWLSQPWRRVYSLNYDDLEVAAARQFDLPREPYPLTGATDSLVEHMDGVSGRRLPTIHLNGFLADQLRDMTASPKDYGVRLGRSEPWYELFVAELTSSCCVFVGTELDEPILWKYIELREARSKQASERRPRSFLVVPRVGRAKRARLAEYGVQHVPCTAKEFAELILAPLASATRQGLERLSAADPSQRGAVSVPDVAGLLAAAPRSRTDFLIGEQPTWGDVAANRAAARRCSTEIAERVVAERTAVRTAAAARGRPRRRSAVIVVTGTAGSGKSSALMQAMAVVSAKGLSVAWIDSSFDRPLADLRAAVAANRFDVVAIDDVDRYSRRAPSVVRDMLASETVQVVVLTVRSSRADAVASLKEDASIALVEYAMPSLDDEDIDAILDVLAANHHLGVLTGKPRDTQRKAFRESAERQLLVAMIEATSGKRFGQKVIDEWQDLPDAQRETYLAVSLASALREPLTQEDVLLCLSNRPGPEAYAALRTLIDRHILVRGVGGPESIRARHRVIAEKLLDELDAQKHVLALTCEKLAYAVATRVTAGTRRDSRLWRLLTRVISNQFLMRRVGLDAARALYAALEDLLAWDYHFWLQRGSLEVKNGSVQYAERYLNTAYGLESRDRLVVTEYAYMLMKKATASSHSEDAEKWVEDGRKLLLEQIQITKTDDYPYHVLGAQSVAWAMKCTWPKEKRVRFLRDAKRTVDAGIKALPGSRDLRQLSSDIETKIHAVQLGFS